MMPVATCPRCGVGRDTNGDGHCAVCVRMSDELAAQFRAHALQMPQPQMPGPRAGRGSPMSTNFLTDAQLRALVDLLMVSDPLPLSWEDRVALVTLAGAESEIRGFNDWHAAYHGLEVPDAV